jgi:hypothetical protein
LVGGSSIAPVPGVNEIDPCFAEYFMESVAGFVPFLICTCSLLPMPPPSRMSAAWAGRVTKPSVASAIAIAVDDGFIDRTSTYERLLLRL